MTFKTATSPAVNALSVTPSDTVFFDPPCKALYVGGGGSLQLVLADDSIAVLFAGVSSGQFLDRKSVV